LKKTVENGRTFNTVFCYDESRWGRAIDPAENSFWIQYFKRLGVVVILVKTSVDPKSEFADVLGALERSQASSYSKKVSELTLRGAKSNRKYSNGGSAPYGYVRLGINTKTGARRELAPGEWATKGQEKVTWGLGAKHEIDTVRMIFSSRVAGQSYMLIAMKLNDQNIPCPRRGRWRNRDQMWSPVTIKSILENHAYYGTRVYNRNSMSKIRASQRGEQVAPGIRYPHWVNDPAEWIIEENADCHKGRMAESQHGPSPGSAKPIKASLRCSLPPHGAHNLQSVSLPLPRAVQEGEEQELLLVRVWGVQWKAGLYPLWDQA
jgi:hypothetical protein